VQIPRPDVERGRAPLRNASIANEHRAVPHPTRIYLPRSPVAVRHQPTRTTGQFRTGLASGRTRPIDVRDVTNRAEERHLVDLSVAPALRPDGQGKGRTGTA
jgi:hypothetical protein